MAETQQSPDILPLLAKAGIPFDAPHALIRVAEDLLKKGEMQASVSIANFAVLLSPTDARVLRGASGIIAESRNYQRCAELMERAVALAPEDADSRLHYGIILIELREYTSAHTQLKALLKIDPNASLGWRNLSSVYACQGDYEAANEAVMHALEIEPKNREYAIHQAGLLIVLQRIQEVYGLLQSLDADKPNDPVVTRLLSAAAEVAGDSDRAIAYAERAHQLAPHNLEYEQHLEHLAQVRGQTFSIPVARRILGSSPPRVSVEYSSYARGKQGALSMFRVIIAVLIREASTRFSGTRLGYFWAILEPASHLALLAVVFSFLHTGSHPPIGQSILIYYFTGVLPYLLFTNTIMHLQAGLASNRSLLQIPIVKPLDVLLARALLELITQSAVALIMLTLFGLFGLPSMPYDVIVCIEAMLVVWLMAIGFGVFNSVVHHFIRSWEHLFASLTRALYFTSGIFISPLMMPPPIRDILAWNPLLQGIDLFRKGFFEFYDPNWLNVPFLFACALVVLALGLAMERALRRYVSTPT